MFAIYIDEPGIKHGFSFGSLIFRHLLAALKACSAMPHDAGGLHGTSPVRMKHSAFRNPSGEPSKNDDTDSTGGFSLESTSDALGRLPSHAHFVTPAPTVTSVLTSIGLSTMPAQLHCLSFAHASYCALPFSPTGPRAQNLPSLLPDGHFFMALSPSLLPLRASSAIMAMSAAYWQTVLRVLSW